MTRIIRHAALTRRQILSINQQIAPTNLQLGRTHPAIVHICLQITPTSLPIGRANPQSAQTKTR
jgi:hypothetical protein